MTLDLIVGARPNFIKIAPIIKAIKAKSALGFDIHFRLVHTGQHYDEVMSGNFFAQLDIPEPAVNLAAGSGSQAEQTARIMIAYEQLLQKSKPDLTLVVGDVNSTMACAITAKKMQLPIAHIEAGIRSGDWSMPEEVNRVVTDSITDYFFTTSAWASANLKNQGVPENHIYFVGNVMIDTLLHRMPYFKKPEFYDLKNLEEKKYLVLTLHRPNNVDGADHFKKMLQTVLASAKGHKIIFPVHPRTAAFMQKVLVNFKNTNLIVVNPLGYLEFNYLVQKSMGVVTDSGGITEEASTMNIPCITLRENTERPETVTYGTNEIIGRDPSNLIAALDKLINGRWKQAQIIEKWDGRAAVRIVDILCDLYL